MFQYPKVDYHIIEMATVLVLLGRLDCARRYLSEHFTREEVDYIISRIIRESMVEKGLTVLPWRLRHRGICEKSSSSDDGSSSQFSTVVMAMLVSVLVGLVMFNLSLSLGSFLKQYLNSTIIIFQQKMTLSQLISNTLSAIGLAGIVSGLGLVIALVLNTTGQASRLVSGNGPNHSVKKLVDKYIRRAVYTYRQREKLIQFLAVNKYQLLKTCPDICL